VRVIVWAGFVLCGAALCGAGLYIQRENDSILLLKEAGLCLCFGVWWVVYGIERLCGLLEERGHGV